VVGHAAADGVHFGQNLRRQNDVAGIATTGSTGWIALGATFAAVLLGFFAYWALNRGSRRAGELASVTSIGEASAQRTSSPAQQSERKAA